MCFALSGIFQVRTDHKDPHYIHTYIHTHTEAALIFCFPLMYPQKLQYSVKWHILLQIIAPFRCTHDCMVHYFHSCTTNMLFYFFSFAATLDWKKAPSPLVACWLISRCRSRLTISSKISPSPLMSRCLPVSSSYTLRITL